MLRSELEALWPLAPERMLCALLCAPTRKLSEEDHGRIEPLGGPTQRSFLLQSIPKIYRGTTVRNQIPIYHSDAYLDRSIAKFQLVPPRGLSQTRAPSTVAAGPDRVVRPHFE